MDKIIIPTVPKIDAHYDRITGAYHVEFPEGGKGDVSDGYHTFDDLYRHRYALFVALAVSYPNLSWCSLLHDDGTMFEDSFIVGMDLPTGMISYHLPMREYEWVSKKIKVIGNAPKWDGHTPEDVIDRLKRFVTEYQ
jgi:hypothetical protein